MIRIIGAIFDATIGAVLLLLVLIAMRRVTSMRVLIALLVIVYLVGVGVALAPTDQSKLEHRPRVAIRRECCDETTEGVVLAGDGISQHCREAQCSREAPCARVA